MIWASPRFEPGTIDQKATKHLQKYFLFFITLLSFFVTLLLFYHFCFALGIS